jgi:hypothetical protein
LSINKEIIVFGGLMGIIKSQIYRKVRYFYGETKNMATNKFFPPAILKTAPIIFTAFALSVLTGCQTVHKEVLTVDFQKDQVLRYKFISSRDIEVDWSALATNKSSNTRSEIKQSSESVEMIVSYMPVEVTPGLTTVKATCESVKVTRNSETTRQRETGDAVESLAGKTFTFNINAAGKIEDYSQIEALIKEAGEKAFRSRGDNNRIKEPDMIGDFTATQWFLWNSVSSIKKPINGVSIGQTWNSTLSVPLPMVAKQGRDVTYKLEQVRDSNDGRIAVITSTYLSAREESIDWPLPYSGSFQMTGTFGFLRNYKLLDLQGTGQEFFNVDKGRIERYDQRFEAKFDAAPAMSLGANPKINIKQTLTMQLLKPQAKN